MRQKLKPELDLDEVQADLIETVCYSYSSGKSIRAVAKELELSPMKVRKILITANAYSTELSTEIGELWKDGKTVGEIAEMLNTSAANVNSYLPYERIIYNMEEKSVEADRQTRYRDRLRARTTSDVSVSDGDEDSDAGVLGVSDNNGVRMEKMPLIERMRTKTMIIVIGKKLRRLLPADVFDSNSDPLARDQSYTWGSNVGGEFVLHEPADPDKMIWCAEVTSNGRGDKKKQGIVLMSANCGFAVITSVPPAPTLSTFSTDEDEKMSREEKRKAEEENDAKLKEYRTELETLMLDSIRRGMLDFALPEYKVLDYTDTVRRIELVKGRTSTPGVRLEEMIERELKWKEGADPVEAFNVRGNWGSRKFGNGDYRHVEKAVFNMLGMNEAEQTAWMDRFLAPMRERMNSVADPADGAAG